MDDFEVDFVIVEGAVAVFSFNYEHALELVWDYLAALFRTLSELDPAFEVFLLVAGAGSLDLG